MITLNISKYRWCCCVKGEANDTRRGLKCGHLESGKRPLWIADNHMLTYKIL